MPGFTVDDAVQSQQMIYQLAQNTLPFVQFCAAAADDVLSLMTKYDDVIQGLYISRLTRSIFRDIPMF